MATHCERQHTEMVSQHTCTHARTHTRTRAHTHTHTSANIHSHTYREHTCTHTHARTHTPLHTYREHTCTHTDRDAMESCTGVTPGKNISQCTYRFQQKQQPSMNQHCHLWDTEMEERTPSNHGLHQPSILLTQANLQMSQSTMYVRVAQLPNETSKEHLKCTFRVSYRIFLLGGGNFWNSSCETGGA